MTQISTLEFSYPLTYFHCLEFSRSENFVELIFAIGSPENSKFRGIHFCNWLKSKILWIRFLVDREKISIQISFLLNTFTTNKFKKPCKIILSLIWNIIFLRLKNYHQKQLDLFSNQNFFNKWIRKGCCS